MGLKEKIESDTKQAMREKDALRLLVLRMLSSAFHNRVIEKRGRGLGEELSEEESVAVLRSEVKRRKDAIREFEKGGRRDLVDKESSELAILEVYLPPELSDEELERILLAVLQKIGSVTAKDFGRIMGEVMEEVKGQASGDKIGRRVREILDA